MKVLHAVALLGLPALCFSQWVHYPPAGVPRKADGTPNLTAPAPRLADGKPDFSGIWHTARIIACDADLSRFINCGNEIGGSPLARNFGLDMPGGLPYQPWAAALVKQRTADQGVDDPHVRCLPDNPPRTWVMPHLTRAMHTPKLLVLLYEVNAMYRQRFIDGRPLPQDQNPGWTGYSTARWQGDTLVVRTSGFRNDLWADMSGSPLSESATLTERIRRPNYGTLELEGKPGEPVYRIVEGIARDGRIHFFVLHDSPEDPEVKANGGNPFHNVATGTFTGDAIEISGSLENTKIREYRMVLKRVSEK